MPYSLMSYPVRLDFPSLVEGKLCECDECQANSVIWSSPLSAIILMSEVMEFALLVNSPHKWASLPLLR